MNLAHEYYVDPEKYAMVETMNHQPEIFSFDELVQDVMKPAHWEKGTSDIWKFQAKNSKNRQKLDFTQCAQRGTEKKDYRRQFETVLPCLMCFMAFALQERSAQLSPWRALQVGVLHDRRPWNEHFVI